MGSKRQYRHPDINHTFEIEDINFSEIEIDGIRINKSDLDGLLTMANSGGSSVTIKDISLPVLQHVILAKKVKKLDKLLKQ